MVGERRPGGEHCEQAQTEQRRVKVGLDLSLAPDWVKRDERADNFPLRRLRSVIRGAATITTSRHRPHSLLLSASAQCQCSVLSAHSQAGRILENNPGWDHINIPLISAQRRQQREGPY